MAANSDSPLSLLGYAHHLIVRKTAKATRSNQLQITHFIKYTDMKKKTSKKSEAPLKEVVEQAVEQIT